MKHPFYASPEDSRELAALFRHASRLMKRAHHDQGEGHRGRHAQGRLLALIREHGPVNRADLLEMLDVRSASLSELLAKLERRGLISRERSETDKRSFIVSATSAADNIINEREDTEQAIADRLFAALDDEEKKDLHAILLKLVTALQSDTEPERGRGRGRCLDGRGQGRGQGRRPNGMGGGRGGRGGKRGGGKR